MRGAVVEWLERFGYSTDIRRKACVRGWAQIFVVKII